MARVDDGSLLEAARSREPDLIAEQARYLAVQLTSRQRKKRPQELLEATVQHLVKRHGMKSHEARHNICSALKREYPRAWAVLDGNQH